jgi:hypothetical protein
MEEGVVHDGDLITFTTAEFLNSSESIHEIPKLSKRCKSREKEFA